MRVVLIGNFAVPYTTESYLHRALTECGAAVLPFQQDQAHALGAQPFADLLITGALAPAPNLLIYVRTHNRTALGPVWTDAWQRLQTAGAVTASFHLDRFWDLERERLIFDADPLFTTQHVFTADGGNDDRWHAAGINHHWLPPAVDREEAEYEGQPVDGVPDIVFAGSGGRTYHAAYPERAALLAHLNRTYRTSRFGRFGHYGHGGDRPVVRQHALNDVYASAKIVVGDSCFANQRDPERSSHYWSDRVPETIGRGGFLLHPWVPGLRAQYGGTVATYRPGDWEDLDAQIGAYLANEGDRRTMVESGRARVLAAHTYTHRMRELLDVVGLPAAASGRDRG